MVTMFAAMPTRLVHEAAPPYDTPNYIHYSRSQKCSVNRGGVWTTNVKAHVTCPGCKARF